jgi:hypothetical protein
LFIELLTAHVLKRKSRCRHFFKSRYLQYKKSLPTILYGETFHSVSVLALWENYDRNSVGVFIAILLENFTAHLLKKIQRYRIYLCWDIRKTLYVAIILVHAVCTFKIHAREGNFVISKPKSMHQIRILMTYSILIFTDTRWIWISKPIQSKSRFLYAQEYSVLS